MKKALSLFIAFILMGGIYAQVSFGPKVGFPLSKYAYDYSSAYQVIQDDTKFKLGLAIGGVMDMQVTDFLAFQPSLMVSHKGTGIDVAERESGDAVITGYERYNVTYLEVPLNLALGIKLGTFRFQLYAGPYFAYALAGKKKWNYEENVGGDRTDFTGNEKITFGNEMPEDFGDDYSLYQNPLDAGINFGVGYQVKQLLFNLGFAMGFTNLQAVHPDSDSFADDHNFANRSICLSAAWLFGTEK